MLGNLPNDDKLFTADTLMETLEGRGFAAGKFDFFYMPIDFGTWRNLGYAFVNFRDPADALKCMNVFHDFKDWPVFGDSVHWRKVKNCTTSYGTVQGMDAIIRRLKKSSVPHMVMKDNFKPIIFDKQGKRIPLREAIWGGYTDRRRDGHSWSWSYDDSGRSGWSRRSNDSHGHGWNEGPPTWANSGKSGKGTGMDTDATGPEPWKLKEYEKAWQCQCHEGEAAGAVAEPTSVSEARGGRAHASVAAGASAVVSAGAAEPTSVSVSEAEAATVTVGDRAHESVAAKLDPVQPLVGSSRGVVGSFDFAEAKLRHQPPGRGEAFKYPPHPVPSSPTIAGPAARPPTPVAKTTVCSHEEPSPPSVVEGPAFRYACPACSKLFRKRSACQHHMYSDFKCKPRCKTFAPCSV